MNRGAKIALIAGVALLLGGGAVAGGAYYYYYLRKKTPASQKAYDLFDQLKGSSPAGPAQAGTVKDCEDKCTADETCKSYSFNPTTSECTVSSLDPYLPENWASDPSWSMYVKRDSTAPASSFSDWSACPACGGDVDHPTPAWRTCTGKCPGPTTKTCPVIPCASSEPLPVGWVPYPLPSGADFKVFSGASLADCSTDCIGDPTCKSWGYFKKAENSYSCYTSKTPATGIISGTPTPLQGYSCYVTEPQNLSAQWGPWPDCVCGKNQLNRTCLTGTNCVGPVTKHCPGTPCAYDPFSQIKGK